MKTYDTIIKWIDKVMEVLLTITELAMLIVLLLQIIQRFVAFIPIPWSQEFLTFLLVASVFLGAPSATNNGKQIRLEFFVDFFPKRVGAIILCLADLIAIVFLVIICKDAFRLGMDYIHTFIGANPVSLGVHYLVVSVGFGVMALNFVNLILKRIPTILGKEPETAVEEGAQA